MVKEAEAVAYFTDTHDAVIGHVGCICVASTWGPAVDNTDWFVAYRGRNPFRVPSREEALSLLPVRWCWSDDEDDIRED